jgi:hypothetical protein
MIPISVSKGPTGYKCSTDAAHLAVATWLETDLRRSGGGGMAEEFFEDIGAFLSGTKGHAQVWGDLFRVTIGTQGALVEMMPPSIRRRCEVPLEDLVDAVLRWFDAVNPELAKGLREIQANWPRKSPGWPGGGTPPSEGG